MNPIHSDSNLAINSRGHLRNGNPSGNPSSSPRCGAATRSGKPCAAPAMWSDRTGRYTRCRLHGGKSTGPRTLAGLERSRKANWKTGHYSAKRRNQRRAARAVSRLIGLYLKTLERRDKQVKAGKIEFEVMESELLEIRHRIEVINWLDDVGICPDEFLGTSRRRTLI